MFEKAPLQVTYQLSVLHLKLFENIYLVSQDGAIFFKTASVEELLTYRFFKMRSSPLLPFLQEMLGLYKCVNDVLILVVDLHFGLLEIDVKAVESILANTRKARSLGFDGTFFLAFEHINTQIGLQIAAKAPSFIDLKLGTHTFALNASPEKVRSQEEKARNSTTSSHGVRLMGAVIGAELQNGEPEVLSKAFGRSCKYSDILTIIRRLIANKRECHELTEKLKELSASLRQEDVYMSGSSLLIYRKTDGIGVLLIDFSHTYPQNYVTEPLVSSDKALEALKSATIARHVDSLSEDLLLHWNSFQMASSSSL